MVYKLSCCVFNSISVEQTVRHLVTRIAEYKKEDSLVGFHVRQCGEEATTVQLNWEIRDHSNNAIKLLTLEALHIRKLRPGINTRGISSGAGSQHFDFSSKTFWHKISNMSIEKKN